MVLDFAEKYLRKIEDGISPVKAITQISGEYVAGASDKAQLAQIFYHALTGDTIPYESLTATMPQIHPLMSYEEGLENVITTEAMLAQLSELEKFPELETAKLAIELTHSNLIAQQFGLTVTFPKIYMHENFEKECDFDFKQHLEDLPNGCYLTSFGNQKSAHATLLIKVDGEYFLFNPSHATLAYDVDELAEHMWKEALSMSNKEKPHAFYFSPLTLKTFL